MNAVLAALWLASLVQIFWPHPYLAAAGGAALALYVMLALPGARRQIQVLCAALGLAAAALAIAFDGWGSLWHGIERAVVFAAFFGTLSLLRATADRRPEIGRARARVAALGDDERASGLMVGANLLGAVLVVGVMAIFAPIVGRDVPFETRMQAALASQRGMCLASFWSPFWVGMSVCYVHLPGVALWQLMALGIAMNALGLVTAQALYAPGVGRGGLVRALGALPFGVSDLVLMEAALVGWGFASMIGLSAVSVATAAAMFGVPLERVAYGPNMRFVAGFGVIAVAALAAVNSAIV